MPQRGGSRQRAKPAPGPPKQKRGGTWDEFKIPEQEEEAVEQRRLRRRALKKGDPPPLASLGNPDGLSVARAAAQGSSLLLHGGNKTKRATQALAAAEARTAKLRNEEQGAAAARALEESERFLELHRRVSEADIVVRVAAMAALNTNEEAMLTQSSRSRKRAADAYAYKQVCEIEAARARKARDDAAAWREVQKELERKKKQREHEKKLRKAEQMEEISADLEFIQTYQRKQEGRLTHEWTTRQNVAHVLRVRGALEQRGIFDLPPVPAGMDLHNINPTGDPRLRVHKIELDQFVERRMRKEEDARELEKQLEAKALHDYLAEEAEKIEQWKEAGGAAMGAGAMGAVASTPGKQKPSPFMPGGGAAGAAAGKGAKEQRSGSPARSSRSSPQPGGGGAGGASPTPSARSASQKAPASPPPADQPAACSVGAVVAIMHQAEHLKTGGEQWYATERTKMREWTLAGVPTAPRAPTSGTASSASIAGSNGGLLRGRPLCVQAFGLYSTSAGHKRLREWRGEKDELDEKTGRRRPLRTARGGGRGGGGGSGGSSPRYLDGTVSRASGRPMTTR